MCTWRDQEAILANENPLWGLLPSPVPENGMSSGTAPWCLIHGPFPSLWGKLHVNSILEPGSGDGMIYIPQSRQGLDFSQGLRSRCWQGRWIPWRSCCLPAGLSSSPLIFSLGPVPLSCPSAILYRLLTFCPHCSP